MYKSLEFFHSSTTRHIDMPLTFKFSQIWRKNIYNLNFLQKYYKTGFYGTFQKLTTRKTHIYKPVTHTLNTILIQSGLTNTVAVI